MLEKAEKLKQNLSNDTEAVISIDYLIEGKDLDVEMTREKFENIIEPQTD